MATAWARLTEVILTRSLLFPLVACSLMWAQGADDSLPAPTNMPGAEYPRVHSDNRVTFRLRAPSANKVQVQPNMVDVNTVGTENGLGKGPYDMIRSPDGVWTVTTPPAVPGFHLYHFVVDGVAMTDPGSESYVSSIVEVRYSESFPVSGIEVPEKGPGADFYQPHDVPHGVVQELWYFSKVTGAWRHAFVYTPPDYDRDTRVRYPILYLQHGGAEDPTSWVRQGKVSFIMDNLLAAKKAVPMLVVMERGYAERPGEKMLVGPENSNDPAAVQRYLTQRNATADAFEDLLIRDLIPTIDARYRTIPDRDHRAFAGLSRGARQALTIGLNQLGTFAYIGAFSPASAVRGFKPDTSFNGIFSKPAVLNAKLKLLWVGDGTAELTYQDMKSFHEALGRLGVKHTYYESPGTAHEFLTWRRHLNDFAPRLFQSK